MFSAKQYFSFWAHIVNTKVTKPLWTGAVVVYIHVVVLKPSDMGEFSYKGLWHDWWWLPEYHVQALPCSTVWKGTHYTYSNSANSTVFNGVVDQCSWYVDTFKLIKVISTAGTQKGSRKTNTHGNTRWRFDHGTGRL